jgi:hypothetical protein
MVNIYKVPRDDTITIGSTSTEVSPETSTQRIVWVVTNVSTAGQIISLGIGKEAIAGKGIVLYPTGAWAESVDSAFKPTLARITAIASAANGSITIHERVE